MPELGPSSAPEGVVVDAVDWLPSGAGSGLVRVRGRQGAGPLAALPDLVVAHAQEVRRFASLPDLSGAPDAHAWRGAYVVPADLVAAAGNAMRLEWSDGRSLALPQLRAGEPRDGAGAAGAEVVDRAELAERRARRAVAAEQAQARIASEALRAFEVIEQRANEIEGRLGEVTAQRDALARGLATGEPVAGGPAALRVVEDGRDVLARELDAARLELIEARAERDELRGRVATLETELAAAREQAARAAAQARAETERRIAGAVEDAVGALRTSLEGSLAVQRPAVEPAPQAPSDLAARAAEQAAIAAARQPVAAGGDRLVADLAAAAESLRRRTAAVGAAELPAARPLRSVLVRLAEEDPRAAAQLLAGLLPAQWRAIGAPLAYDLTIRELGTFAIDVTAQAATVEPVARPRRKAAAFHLRADALTLARMLAGEGPRPRRFAGPARLSGSARAARALAALPAARLTLAQAVHAGAELDPVAVLRGLAHAVRPSWTRGHEFVIEETITGGGAETVVYVCARDAEGITVSEQAPARAPDARITISRGAFAALLAGTSPPPGERPSTRGDHRAVEQLRAWADRARRGG